MAERWKEKVASAPAQAGLLFFQARRGAPLFIGLFDDLQKQGAQFCADDRPLWRLLAPRVATVEIVTAADEQTLLQRYRLLLAQHQPELNLVFADQPRYPHFKLTVQEKFPRLLATRRVRDDGARYFGPLLPASRVRRLLDLANRIFTLRSCELELDGSFVEPCAEYFAGRCLGPCVARLCDETRYNDAVNQAQTFLSGEIEALIVELDWRINAAAEHLDFEQAGELRDLREVFQELATEERWRLGADGTLDLFTCAHQVVSDGRAHLGVHLTTARSGKAIGEQMFFRENVAQALAEDYAVVLSQILAQWYGDYAPGRVFVPVDFFGRKVIRRALSQRSGRKVEVTVATLEQLPPMARLAGKDAVLSLNTRFLAAQQDQPAAVLQQLAQQCGLAVAPRRIETFDVAHISGQQAVAAMSVCWEGKLQPADGAVWAMTEMSEPAAMAEAIRRRFALLLDAPEGMSPDLILLDGGRSQLNAVKQALEEIGRGALPLVAVVKPPRRHNQISHLLSSVASTREIKLPADSAALRLIGHLRDEAHRLANEFHRKRRDAEQLAAQTDAREPLLVPTRLDEPGGAAEDLRPIRALDQHGRLLNTRKQATRDGQPKERRRSNNPFAIKSLMRDEDEA